MIISICGAKGQGKSEIISCLKEEGYKIETLNSDISKIENLEQFCAMQDRLFESRLHEVQTHLRNGDVEPLIFESSFVEMFVYSTLVISINFDYSEWLGEYGRKCLAAQDNIDYILKLPFENKKEVALPYYTSLAFNILTDHYHSNNMILEIGENMSSEDRCDYISDIIDTLMRGKDGQ